MIANQAAHNNPSSDDMLARTLQLIGEQDAPLSPSSYGSVGSPADSHGSYSSLPGLHHDNPYSPISTAAEASHMMGFPSTARTVFQNNHFMDLSCEVMRTPPLTHNPISLPPVSCPDIAGSPNAVNPPYLTPPRDDWAFSDLSDIEIGTEDFGDEFLNCSAADLDLFAASAAELSRSMNLPTFSQSTYQQASTPATWGACTQQFNTTCNTTAQRSPNYFQPSISQHGCVNNVSPMSVLEQAHHVPTPTGRQWIGAPSTHYQSMVNMPKDVFTKPYGKTDLPIVALWEFLLEALYYPCYEHILKWKNKPEGDFKIVNSSGLAKLWGVYKRKKDMNFDKMSRAMRYYYDKGILEKGSSGARLEYKFGPRSNWMDFRPPHGSVEGRFFQSQPPRRTRGNRSIAPNNAKANENKPAPVSNPLVVVPPTSVGPLSHAPLQQQQQQQQQQTFSQHGHHAFNKPAACVVQNRYSPY